MAQTAEARFLSAVHEQFADAIGKALIEPHHADEGGRPWKARTVLHSDREGASKASATTTVALRFEGDLTGEALLCLAHKGSDLLLGQAAEAEAADPEAKWLKLVSASRNALTRALEPVFGAVVLHPSQVTAADSRQPIAELRIRQGEGTEEAVVGIVLDPALGTSLERLAMATRALSNDPATPSSIEDRERLHRVIDVPLAVTLRFGERQMSLRELLALSTGSLVELDRQVEEPVELMLGDRVVARGEVVIVDGNYGMRVIEVIEGSATRATSVAV